MANQKGFTLIELMMVVAIISILAGIVVPQFADTMRKAYEARTKGNLGVLRSALAIYYGDMEGLYPSDDLSSLTPRYLKEIPMKYTPPYHPEGNTVSHGSLGDMTLARGDWFYFSVQGDSAWGKIVVNCIHEELHGAPWSSY